MKMLFVNRNIIVSIFVVMLLIYGGQSISYGQGKAPTVTPGETNTTINVSFRDTFYAYDEKSYQVQLRRKEPQGDWILKCGTIRDFFDSGARTFVASFTDLEPDTTYQARWRETNEPNCSDNPPNPDPWSPIGEGTTLLVTPPRVEFVDAKLARAVRIKLKLYTLGVELLKIPEAKLATLTHFAYNIVERTPFGNEPKISDLTGLEHATQLSTLSFENNNLRDITPLAQLTQLTELNLRRNNISDITPLTQLTQLTKLNLTSNNISDLTPLSELTQLTELYISGNKIKDLTPLTQLTELPKLILADNNISDITPLAQLTQLTELNVYDNNISNITPLAQLTQLPKLSLGRNNISDLKPLAQLTQLKELRLGSNKIKDITPLAQLTQLTELDLSLNNISDVTPLVELISLERLFLGHNPIEDTFPLNALLEANPDVYIDIEVVKEKRGPTLTVSTLQPLTGATLGGAIVTLTLSSGSFSHSSLVGDALTISGILGVGIVEWTEFEPEGLKPREIRIKLTFEGNIITTDSVLTLTVDPKAIVGYNGDPYTLELPVTGVTESELSQAITVSAPYPLTEATLHGSTITLKLTDAVFSYGFWNYIEISGIPGITFPTGRKVSDTEITFELSFYGNIDTDTALIFTVKPDGIDGYNGPSLTTEIPVSASTEAEATGELVASSAFPLTKATLNGSVVKLTLQNKSYQGSSYDYDEPMIGISGISGIKTEWLGSGSYLWILSKTEIWVWLGGFTGNLDTDAMLTFTVPPSLIKDYNGPPLAATLPITAKTGKQMLVSEHSRPSMYWINTDTHKIESLNPFDAVTNQVASLTVDTADGKIYWSEHSSSGGVIKRANLDGTNVEVLVTHPTTPQSITVDTAEKRFYWINSLEGKIQSADLSGGNIKTIIQLDDTITHIAVDAEGGKLYWADSEFRIRRMNLDGTGIETILTGWNSYLPRGIGGMVIADGKIYWTERQIWYQVGGKIHRANLNGTNLETLATSLGEPVGIAVDTVGGKVYWTNSYGGIQRMDINGGEIENVVYGIAAPGDLGLGTAVTLTTLTTPETPATTDATVSISPASVASSAIGEQITFNLNITGDEAVAGYQATVQFDDTALRYVSGANGDYLPAGAFFVKPVVEGNRVKLNAASLAGESNGDGFLATLTFEVIAAQASALTLSDVLLSNSAGETFVPQVENAEITEPTGLKGDVNGDGQVNIADLVLVASNLGKTGQNAADVNGDGQVNIADLVLVAGALGNSAAAPSLHPHALEMLTATEVKHWLSAAQQLDLTDAMSERGILFLQQLLEALTPKETALLPNYPNPFNPETWIPYHLAKDAEVTLHIYAVNGTLVRTLILGHQAAGMYQNRSGAAYWDGKNEFGEPVASGVYFYTLTAGDFTATRKMLIRK